MAAASTRTETASPAVVAAAAPTYENAGIRVTSSTALNPRTATAMPSRARCSWAANITADATDPSKISPAAGHRTDSTTPPPW
jgi:hypothetical protein